LSESDDLISVSMAVCKTVCKPVYMVFHLWAIVNPNRRTISYALTDHHVQRLANGDDSVEIRHP
jgi:hypothetical protein